MTAPTSPKPRTPANLTESKDVPATLDNEAADAGLRTALTKLADNLTPDERAVAYDIRALLAAHPAPTPVSDTRREDVGAAGPDSASGRGVQVPDYYGDGHLEVHATPGRAYADLTINTYGHWSIDITVDQLVDAIEKAGGPHLAALPAPPVIDEAARVLELAADDMEAVIALGDAAESTAVPAGTKGVGSALGARDALYEDPVAWLRERAAITTTLSQEDA